MAERPYLRELYHFDIPEYARERIKAWVEEAREKGRQEECARWAAIVRKHSDHYARGADCVDVILWEAGTETGTHGGGSAHEEIRQALEKMREYHAGRGGREA